jgi:NDP-sugar pyrophosphorylase family protein
MKAMILAAGFGTRLFPLTIDRTKPAIPFLGKPLVGYVAEYVAGFGFKDVVVNLHHQPDSVIEALGDGSDFGVHIHYTLEEPEILGTAGALDNARQLLENDTFLIVNGKIITDIDISEVVKTHWESGALATMVLMENRGRERFTIVESENGLVTRFSGFPSPSESGEPNPPLMFTGIHIVEPAVFDYIPRGTYSDIVQVFYKKAIDEGKPIAAHVATGTWYELSTIPRYLDISLAMMPEDQNVFSGARSSISASSSVTNSVIWDDVVIEDNVRLDRAIVADGVRIVAGSRFENVAIVRAEMLTHTNEVPEKALHGEYIGDNYVVPLG